TAPRGSHQITRYQLKKSVSKAADGSPRVRWVSEHEFGHEAGPETLVVEVQIGGLKATRYEFEGCLRQVKIRQDDPAFNDRIWIQEALANLAREHVLTKQSILTWEIIESTIIDYYLEQLQQGHKGMIPAPFDLMPYGIAAT
ncbi:hypothetical protein KEM52_003015, partial [Ascosphaera acerosa]